MKKSQKQDLYRIEEFNPLDLVQMQVNMKHYAHDFGGLPLHHSEVFEKRGWLIPFLWAYDDLLWGRWSYWMDICTKGTIVGSGPIPQIKWAGIDVHEPAIAEVNKMFTRCLTGRHEGSIDTFSDWLLWGLAATKEQPRISAELNEHYYKTFDLFLPLRYPTDYMSNVLCEETGRGYKQGLGYYPTPFNVCLLMNQMVMSGGDPEKMKRKTVMEPAVGCGALLLPSSNQVLRGFAQDVSSIAIKLCKIQMYWYAPWFAFHPDGIKGFEDAPAITMSTESLKGVAEGQQMFVFS